MAYHRILTTDHGRNRLAFTATDWGLFVALSLIWGASFLFIAIALDAFHPGLVTWMRIVLGASVLTALPGSRRVRISRADRGRVWLLGVTWIGIPLTLFPIAQQWIDSAIAGMLGGATPVFTALIATALLKSAPGRHQSLGLVIGFAGIVAVALPSAGEGDTATVGVVLVVSATILYALSVNVGMPLQRRYGALGVMARAEVAAAILTAPFGIYGLIQSTFAWPSLLAVLAVGVLGTGAGFAMIGALADRVGATRASFVTYVNPMVALALGVIFRNEVVAPAAVGGVALVVAGAFLASRRENVDRRLGPMSAEPPSPETAPNQ